MDNLNQIVSPYLNSVLNNFILNLEESLKLKDSFTEEEKKEFIFLLAEILEMTNGYEDLISPNIKDKITNIKRLLSKVDEVYEDKEYPLNTPPLTDGQEN